MGEGKININYEVAGGLAQNLLHTFPSDYIMQDGVSNLPAVLKGYTQGEKGKSVGSLYEALLVKDSQKIGTLNKNFEAFDQSIARGLSNNSFGNVLSNYNKPQHESLIFRIPNS